MRNHEVRIWLAELERDYPLVKRYMAVHRSGHELEAGQWAADDLAPATLVGLAAVLARAHRSMRDALVRFAERTYNPPVLCVPDSAMDLGPGGARVIAADEWPRVQRGVIETSGDIYFRDYLRSLWRRLTASPDL